MKRILVLSGLLLGLWVGTVAGQQAGPLPATPWLITNFLLNAKDSGSAKNALGITYSNWSFNGNQLEAPGNTLQIKPGAPLTNAALWNAVFFGAPFSIQPSNTTVAVTPGYDLSVSRVIGDGNPGGDFIGSGLGLSNVMAANIPPWTINLPLVSAERSSGGAATGAAPVSGLLITVVSNTHITLYNTVPWGMGWSKIVSRLTFESNVANTCYLFVYAWSAGSSGTAQEGQLSGQWVTVPANSMQTAWATNFFLNDNSPRAIQIDVYGNNGYGNLTNYVWLDSWTVLGKD